MAKRSRKRPIEKYEHSDKERLNNPPVGLVTPETDKDARRCRDRKRRGVHGGLYRGVGAELPHEQVGGAEDVEIGDDHRLQSLSYSLG